MQQLEQYFTQILENNIHKLILSKPKKKENEYNEGGLGGMGDFFKIQIQLFHKESPQAIPKEILQHINQRAAQKNADHAA